MNLQQLRTYIDRLSDSLKQEERQVLKSRLRGLISVFPFSEYEYILTFLVDHRVITFGDYEELRDNYVSSNRYLDLFGLAPRIFGGTWGEEHVKDLDHRFRKPDRSLDPGYEGQYDLWLDGMRIEVKASRATNTKTRENLVSKALHYGSDDPFWMNYQQLKLDICEAFVFIGAWVNRIIYWVMSNEEVKTNRFLSHQHRGGIEYQIGIRDNNITDFDVYKVEAESVADTILAKRQL